jgi:signal transduction histidine kinase
MAVPAATRGVRGLELIGAIGLASSVVCAVVVGIAEPEGAFWAVPFSAMYLAGVFAHRRDPGAVAARRLLVFGTLAVVWFAGGCGLVIAYRDLGGGPWLLVPGTVLKALDLALPAALVALLAVYPDGRAHRAHERWLVRLGAALALVVPLLLLLARPTLLPPLVFDWLRDYAGRPPVVHSPLAIGALHGLAGPLTAYGRAAIGILSAIAALLLALRYRRFGPARRLQIRWPLAAALLTALQPVGTGLVSAGVLPDVAANVPAIGALTALALALAVGLVRPGLFDLDRVLSRSLVYLALWAGIGAAYLGVVAAAGIAAGGKGLQVAVAVTIGVTLLFEPARQGLARRAQRWAYGEQPSRAELLRSLGAALEHTMDATQLPATLAATIREGLGAEWVRMEVDGLAPVTDGRAPRRGEDAAGVAALAAGGRRIGTLWCGPAPRGIDVDLLTTLGRQSALALGNARLASELRARAEELAASRTRIVEAEERARRRIERDLHDGVQQELVALIARIGLARGQLDRDPALLRDALADLQAETRQALADLRELAGGIHPSVLGDRGIVEAIEGRAARLPIGATVECDGDVREARFPAAVEGAVYFLVCEAFANALKHAHAEHVVVRLGREAGALSVAVADDGQGFDPAATPRSGLHGLADRTEALGGRFDVDSSPGRGTTLRARFPVAERAAA